MATDYFVLTAVGPDRPGLVDTISEYIFARGGNVEASRAATLGGEFAVVMLLTVDAGRASAVESQVGTLAEAGLSCTIRRTAPPRKGTAAAGTIPYVLDVHAMDHPGIVQAVTHELAEMGINIESLDTQVDSAPHTGTAVFHFHARLNLPAELNIPQCRSKLMALAERHNIDITLTAAAGTSNK
jgi:glycine cleavage system transcriptional repressor